MSNRTLPLTDALYNYILSVSLRESGVMQELREVTAKLKNHEMQISPEQAQFMSFLAELIGAKKTLEIGTFTGYSALAVALSLPDDGLLIACDINEEWTSIAQQYWKKAGVDQKIKLKLAPALETLNDLINQNEENSFDFAFIDADKPSYIDYYERTLQLLRPGGLMILDNVLLNGSVADENNQDLATNIMRELNKNILYDARVSISMLPISDGITLVRKR